MSAFSLDDLYGTDEYGGPHGPSVLDCTCGPLNGAPHHPGCPAHEALTPGLDIDEDAS